VCDTPISTEVETTPIWTSGRPLGNASSALTKLVKLRMNCACLSLVDVELSITNKMSNLLVSEIRFVIASVPIVMSVVWQAAKASATVVARSGRN